MSGFRTRPFFLGTEFFIQKSFNFGRKIRPTWPNYSFKIWAYENSAFGRILRSYYHVFSWLQSVSVYSLTSFFFLRMTFYSDICLCSASFFTTVKNSLFKTIIISFSLLLEKRNNIRLILSAHNGTYCTETLRWMRRSWRRIH